MAEHFGRARLAICAFAVLVLTGQALAITITRLKAFDLVMQDASRPDGFRSFGRLGVYLASLKRAGHRCELTTYEYGGLIDCRTWDGKRVLIDIDAIPTRAPDLAQVDDIRPDGVDSKPITGNDRADFLMTLAGRHPAKP